MTGNSSEYGKTNWFHTMEVITRFLTVAVPIFYIVGRSYIEGYWSALNLDVDVVHYEFNEYLYFGFLSLLAAINKLVSGSPLNALAFLFIVAFAIGSYVLAEPLIALAERPGLKVRARLEALPSQPFWLWPLRNLPKIATLAALSSAVLYIVLTIGLVGAIPMQIAHSLGAEHGSGIKLAIKNWSQKPPEWPRASLKAGNSIQDLRLLSCSGAWCVLASPSGVVVLPQEAIASVHGIAGRVRRRARELEPL